MKSVVLLRHECVACYHAYLSRKISVGDIVTLVGVCTPVMHLLIMFHGEVGGTKEVYGRSRGTESLSGPLSSVTIWRRPLCARRGCQPGRMRGRVGLGSLHSGSVAGEEWSRFLLRVSACADELHLMGGRRDSTTLRI